MNCVFTNVMFFFSFNDVSGSHLLTGIIRVLSRIYVNLWYMVMLNLRLKWI